MTISKILSTAFIVMLMASTTACDRNDGPLEKAGEEVDHAMDHAKDKADDIKDDIKDATN